MSRRLVDQPIASLEDESLGVRQYAEIFEKFIINCETPITIGIQGDWGIGKTSLLNMISQLLAPRRGRRNRFFTIHFNTWQYSQFNQEEFLPLSILKGVINEIKLLEVFAESTRNEKLIKSFNKFGKFVTNLGNQVLKSKTGLDLQKAAETDNLTEDIFGFSEDITQLLQSLKESFGELVSNLIQNEGDKLVILIDDLDRIKPIKALELLEAIKNFLDVNHCVFVIAVDYSVVQAGMAEKLGKTAQELQGKSYFDKIIQVPFNMPVSSYKTDQYIMSLLGWDYNHESNSFIQQRRDDFFLKIRDSSISEEDVNFFANITALTVGKNPRSIKRAVNYANLLRMVVQAKRSRVGSGIKWKLEDAKSLYPLACFQLAWPELFEHFAKDPSPQCIHLMEDFDYLNELPNIDSLFKRVHNPDEVKSNITGFFDEYIGLVDKDGNGVISLQEFRPIWEIMYDANMTNSALMDLAEEWKKIETLVGVNITDVKRNEKWLAFINLLKESRWNDPMNLKLLNAGKKFYNILWNSQQIGSLVSTKKEPLHMYLKIKFSDLTQGVPEFPEGLFFDVSNVGHYGTGDTKINIDQVLKQDNPVNTMEKILDKVIDFYCLKKVEEPDIEKNT